MKIYWSTQSIPELSTLSAAERRGIWWKCVRKAWRRWPFWVAGVGLPLWFVLVDLPVVFLDRFFPGITFIPYAILGCVVMGLGYGVGSLVFIQVSIRIMLPYLREELREYCPSCGYNLKGNISGVCPECGTRKQ